jgi:hypothetical protein
MVKAQEQPRADALQEEGLPWHKPEVVRLTVSLDTKVECGSGADGGAQTNECPSDVRLKRDIHGIEGALDGVLALEGVNFAYDVGKHPDRGLPSGPRIGFIAQDLEKIYPELVTTRDDGFKMVNYAQLVPVLVEAIKEQQKSVVALEAQVSELQRKLATSEGKQPA